MSNISAVFLKIIPILLFLKTLLTKVFSIPHIAVPPKWRTEPSDKSVVMGQPVVFDCQANGYPDPVIRWKKAEGMLKNNFMN